MTLESLQQGRYRRVRQIGSGGMGEVYLMEDTRINRQVAVKVIRSQESWHSNSATMQEIERLFVREARAIAALEHPQILPLYDFGKEDQQGRALTYMVMAFCPDGSLGSWLRQRGVPLSPSAIAFFIEQAADALQYAHDHQILHLDVKASNFLVRHNLRDPGQPTLLLADFGVAQLSATTTGGSQRVRGTPTAMAPEQWAGAPVAATDQYGLAVMAYELVVGRPPFLGGLEQMMFQHFQGVVPLPSRLNGGLSVALDAVLVRALAKRPEERFSSVLAFAHALRDALHLVPPGALAHSAQLTPSTPPTPAFHDEIRATLAISRQEALNGVQRAVGLPGGRRVVVVVPAGAYEGQVLVLSGLDALYDPLILTLTISGEVAGSAQLSDSHPRLAAFPQPLWVSDSHNVQSSEARMSNPNIPTPNPDQQSTIISSKPYQPPPLTQPASYNQASIASGAQHPQMSPLSPPSDGVMPSTPSLAPPPPPMFAHATPLPAPARSHMPKGRLFLLIGLIVIVLLASGIGALVVIANNQAATVRASDLAATAANATAVSATSISATATQASNDAAAATAESATATAQAQDTVTAYQNFYRQETSGSLIMNDPLQDNSQGNQWNVGNAGGGTCGFTNGACHAGDTASNTFVGCGPVNDFGDMTMEVQMNIIKGDCGGLVFRSDRSLANLYELEVCQNGFYYLYKRKAGNTPNDMRLAGGNTLPNFKTGNNQSNVMTIVARGSQFTVYVNKQIAILTVSDADFSHGEIDLAAGDNQNQTDVAYSNLKIWS